MPSVVSLSDILPTGFVGHFVMNRLELKKKLGSMTVFLLFIIYFTSCNASIDDTSKFAGGHTKAFWKSAVEIASPYPRGFKGTPSWWMKGNFSSGSRIKTS